MCKNPFIWFGSIVYCLYTMDILNKIKAIMSSAKESFAKPGEEILGIDIGSSSVKIVELHRKGGKIELFTYGEVALGPYDSKPVGDMARLDTDTLSVAVKDLIAACSAQTRDAIIGVPATQSLVFLLKLPVAARDNLAAVIPNEARKYIPVALSEVVLDWLPLPFSNTEDQTTMQVLVAATRAEALAALKEVAKKSELIVHGYELEIFAQIRALASREISALLIVDIGALKTRVSIVRQGVVYNARMLNFSSHAITTNIMRSMGVAFDVAEGMKKQYGITGSDERVRALIEPSLTQFINEIHAVLREYETTYATTVEKILFIGGGIQMPGLYEYLGQAMDPMLCLKSEAFQMVVKPRFLEPVVAAIDPVFATALGLGERHFDS
jgi:type IV pilus assembly protein PilM